MIIDAQEHALTYPFGQGWHALWQDLAPLLAQGKNLPDGTYTCHGFTTRVRAYSETDASEAGLWKYETHSQFIDLQILLEGREDIWLDITRKNHTLSPVAPYDPKTDMAFFAPHNTPVVRFTIEPGLFCLFFPQDAHAPALTASTLPPLPSALPPAPPAQSGPIKKLVVKIPLSACHNGIFA